ncbi:serine/arginine repetitive matrix protein 2 [Dorcoceras hygrometricum]|uniref:Serine/arginine repetitive matrix protein 2 n=1 Tax=Dorcoceras hygrometricum TaxID=472368 RepID=A0A2Z7CZV9_9LAMI|nr:serine/arginine repetitive matrix protein 2 [Dorcoceras hygrometricum]
MNSRRICPADGSLYKQSAVGLVFMESAAGLAMEMSKVKSALQVLKSEVNQLVHELRSALEKYIEEEDSSRKVLLTNLLAVAIITGSYSGIVSADEKRSAKDEATSSADGLALMTSSVTSSYSADGLREQSQESAAGGRVLDLRVLRVVVPLFSECSLLSLPSMLINPSSSSSSWLSSLAVRGSDLVAISLRRSLVLVLLVLAALVEVVLGQSFVASVDESIRRLISRGNRHFTVGGGRLRQSGPRSEGRLLCPPALEGLTRSARTNSPRQVGRNKFRRSKATAALGSGGF